MWSGYGSWTDILPTVRSPLDTDDHSRSRLAVPVGELRRQGKSSQHLLVCLCWSFPAAGPGRADLRKGFHVWWPLDARSMDARPHVARLDGPGVHPFHLGDPVASRWPGPGRRVGPHGARAVGPPGSHCGRHLQPPQVPLRNRARHLDLGSPARLSKLVSVRPTLSSVPADGGKLSAGCSPLRISTTI